jgi:N-methylhydantoinase A
VPVPAEFTPTNLPAAVQAFHAEHRRLYGFDWQGQVPVEMVRIAVAGRAQGRQIVMRPSGDRGGTVADAQIDARPVYFDGRFLETPCYARAHLGIGAQVAGPAIVEQLDCTTVVLPGQTARVDRYFNLLVEEGRPS